MINVDEERVSNAVVLWVHITARKRYVLSVGRLEKTEKQFYVINVVIIGLKRSKSTT